MRLLADHPHDEGTVIQALAILTQREGSARPLAVAKNLSLACHPGPALGVTVFAAVLANFAGCGVGTTSLLVGAVAAGQLSIGWSNDRWDASRDARNGRRDKPIANGALDIRIVDIAIATALISTVVLSLLLGLSAGLWHLGAVACGWLYNLGAKGTALSWLPYAGAFGALPGVVTLASPGSYLPAVWLVGAGAGLGIVANLTNALPDLADDERTGVRGAPHRLGARRSLVVSNAVMLGVTLLVVIGPKGGPPLVGYAGLGVGAVLSLVGCGWALRHPGSRAIFYGLFLFVALELALLGLTSHHLR